MTVPAYLPYFVTAGTAAMLIAVLYGLNREAPRLASDKGVVNASA
jgi:hypothetical protein